MPTYIGQLLEGNNTVADWNQIVTDYETKIAKLEAEIASYTKDSAAALAILSSLSAVAGLLLGIVIGAVL